MASLNSGVLVKLLEAIGKNKSVDRSRPVLLQIRSIIPLLDEGDLWPDQGFFLKLSDSSHAAYVSLPQEHNELVLSNRLQLGQLIYVHRLEAAYPVPLLKGFSLRPGRHRCVGTPVDLAATRNLAKFWDSSNLDFRRNSVDKKAAAAAAATTKTTTRVRASHDGCRRGGKKLGGDEDWDNCSRSSASSLVTGVSRRSSTGTRSAHGCWGSAHFLSAKPLGGEACSAPVSPVHSEESPTGCWKRRKHIGHGIKSSTQGHKKSRIPVAVKKHEATIHSPTKLASGKGGKPVLQSTETTIHWDSLPSSLARHGKEMLEQRDAAMHAAVEALLEASASERLLKCLSTFSRLQPISGDTKSKPSVDKYLSLQDDLHHTRLIMQSLPSVTNVDTNSTGSVNEVRRLALERKEKATSWIQEAVASDFSTEYSALHSKPTSLAYDQNKTSLKPLTSSHRIKPNSCAQVVTSKHGRNVSADAVAVPPPACWMKETAFYSADELVSSLQNECKRGLLVHVERYLDGVRSIGIPTKSDGQIVGVMSHIKRVSDWIDMMVGNKEGNGGEGISVLEPSEAEACKRVKNKIYGLLLTHIERTTWSGAARG